MSVRGKNAAVWSWLAKAGATLGAATVLGLFAAGAAGLGVPQAVQYMIPAATTDLVEDSGRRPTELDPAAAPMRAALQAKLDALPAKRLDPGSQAVLVEAIDGRVLVHHNADVPLNPASVLKLATTLVALERFGADHRFVTTIFANGTIADGELSGDLCVRSDGDPTFGTTSLRSVVASLKDVGISRVRGDLVVAGPFSFMTTDESPAAAARFRNALGSAGRS